MDYVRKICPTCGSAFVVLKNSEEKGVYCTLHCLSKSQDNPSKNMVSPLIHA